MSRVLSVEPVPVRIGDCECLPADDGKAPHPDGDFAYLRPRLTPVGGVEAQAVLSEYKGSGDYLARLSEVFWRTGMVRWDILDDKGELAAFDWETVNGGTYDWESTIRPIVDVAFDLYGEQAMRPLVDLTKSSKSSRSGQTARSTSRTKQPSPTTPER